MAPRIGLVISTQLLMEKNNTILQKIRGNCNAPGLEQSHLAKVISSL